MNKLSIVSYDNNSSDIVIKNNSEDKSAPYLCQVERSGDGSIVREKKLKYNKDSIQKPVYKSELYQKLKAYRWLLGKNLFIDNDVVKVASDKYFPSNQIYSLNRGAVDGTTLTISDEKRIKTSLEQLFSNLTDSDKENIENMIKTNEVYLLNNSKGSIDFLDMSNTCLLIDYDSDIYTNILDLKKLINKKPIKENTTLKVDLSIQYSKRNEEIDKFSGEIFTYNFDITFSGIEIKDGKVIYKNFINEQNDIRIEYLNGIIQLIPLSSDITECIISNCLVTYGNNKK